MWAPQARGNAMVFYSFAVGGGTMIGPVIGGAICQSYLRWRWTEYIAAIYMFTIVVLDVLILDESSAPILLTVKARKLRRDSGNWALHAKHEEWNVSMGELAHKFGLRPIQMLLTPIVFLVALYASFVFGILYLTLAAFPIEFQEVRGWGQVTGALPYLAVLFGVACGGPVNVLNARYYGRCMAKNGGKAVPEARLMPMMLGSIAFPIGLFIFGWTSSPHIHWFCPVLGCWFLGLGFATIFQQATNYLIDAFTVYAASAVAAITFLRSVFAAAFPLFATPMFHNMGVPWASSVLGFVAIALMPIPFLFHIFGARLRTKDKFHMSS
jgi:Major Facilitator Superfamily